MAGEKQIGEEYCKICGVKTHIKYRRIIRNYEEHLAILCEVSGIGKPRCRGSALAKSDYVCRDHFVLLNKINNIDINLRTRRQKLLDERELLLDRLRAAVSNGHGPLSVFKPGQNEKSVPDRADESRPRPKTPKTSKLFEKRKAADSPRLLMTPSQHRPRKKLDYGPSPGSGKQRLGSEPLVDVAEVDQDEDGAEVWPVTEGQADVRMQDLSTEAFAEAFASALTLPTEVHDEIDGEADHQAAGVKTKGKAQSVKVIIEYPSITRVVVLKDDHPLQRLCLTIGNRRKPSAISNVAYHRSSLKPHLQNCFLKDLSEECKLLSSVKDPSLLRNTSPDQLRDFKWKELSEEWQKRAPLFSKMLNAVTGDKGSIVNGQGLGGSVLLKTRNQEMSRVGYIIGLTLDHSGTTDKVISLMQQIGCSVSTSALLKKKHEISKTHDDVVAAMIGSAKEDVEKKEGEKNILSTRTAGETWTSKTLESHFEHVDLPNLL